MIGRRSALIRFRQPEDRAQPSTGRSPPPLPAAPSSTPPHPWHQAGSLAARPPSRSDWLRWPTLQPCWRLLPCPHPRPRPQGCSGPPSLKGPLPTFAKHCAQHWHGAGNTLVAQPWPHCAGTQGCARPLGRAGPQEHCGADGSVLQTKAKVVLRWVGLRDRKISMGGGGVV